jgi:biotin transport system substrate-specific component
MSVAIALPRHASLVFLAKTLALSLIIAASAHVTVPFWPVPMTLQTMAAMGIAGLFGARLGVAAMLAYLVEGAAGLPVFASGIGAGVLAGPTAGYLAGMIAAAALVGSARGHWQRAVAILLGTAAIYALGMAWLSQFIGVEKAWTLGVLPFLLGDAAKGALVWAACALRRR